MLKKTTPKSCLLMAVGSLFSLQPRLPFSNQPRTSFPFYKFFYSIISARISGCKLWNYLWDSMKKLCSCSLVIIKLSVWLWVPNFWNIKEQKIMSNLIPIRNFGPQTAAKKKKTPTFSFISVVLTSYL